MGDCPSTECHEKVNGHQKILYGEDGRSGLVVDVGRKVEKSCLKKYVPIPSSTILVALFLGVFIPTLLTGIKVWSQTETSSYKYANKKKVQDHEERLLMLEQGIVHMTQEMGEVKEAVKEQKKDMKEQFAEQKKEVKEGLNEIKQMIKDIP